MPSSLRLCMTDRALTARLSKSRRHRFSASRSWTRLERPTSNATTFHCGCRSGVLHGRRTVTNKLQNHYIHLVLHTIYHNFVKELQTLGMTPAMAAGLTVKPYDMEWILFLTRVR